MRRARGTAQRFFRTGRRASGNPCSRSPALRPGGSSSARCAPWSSPPSAAILLVFEGRLALLHERRHAFLLVLESELRMEQSPLEQDAFRQRALVGAVDGF